MKKQFDQNCRNAKNPANRFLKKRTAKSEIEQIFIKRDFENRQLKSVLKRAVEKEFAPQKLIDSIRQEIRS